MNQDEIKEMKTIISGYLEKVRGQEKLIQVELKRSPKGALLFCLFMLLYFMASFLWYKILEIS